MCGVQKNHRQNLIPTVNYVEGGIMDGAALLLQVAVINGFYF